jgi:hypothetical protein
MMRRNHGTGFKLFVQVLSLFFFVMVALKGYTQEDSVGDFVQDPDTASTEVLEYFREKNMGDTLIISERSINPERISKLKRDKRFWYADSSFVEKPVQVSDGYVPLGRRKWFKTLLLILVIGGFAAALVWYLASSNVGLFSRQPATAGTNDTEEIPRNIFDIDFQKEISKAERESNYRLAVRLRFLKLLKEMSLRSIIRYQQDRTNLDYILQLSSTAYYNPFFRLVRVYEYSWYGHFDVPAEKYEVISSEFTLLEEKLPAAS